MNVRVLEFKKDVELISTFTRGTVGRGVISRLIKIDTGSSIEVLCYEVIDKLKELFISRKSSIAD